MTFDLSKSELMTNRVKFEEVLNWSALGINEQLLFTRKEFFKRLQCGAGGKSARFLAGVSHAEYSVSIWGKANTH